jgi:hypothetical protein
VQFVEAEFVALDFKSGTKALEGDLFDFRQGNCIADSLQQIFGVLLDQQSTKESNSQRLKARLTRSSSEKP